MSLPKFGPSYNFPIYFMLFTLSAIAPLARALLVQPPPACAGPCAPPVAPCVVPSRSVAAARRRPSQARRSQSLKLQLQSPPWPPPSSLELQSPAKSPAPHPSASSGRLCRCATTLRGCRSVLRLSESRSRHHGQPLAESCGWCRHSPQPKTRGRA